MKAAIDEASIATLFTDARTHNKWQNKTVEDTILKKVHEVCRMGPTSANCCPMRIIFVKSADARERLRPSIAEGNLEKTMTAPVTAILANDFEFYEKLPQLFPHADARSWFVGNEELIKETAKTNGTLQAAYFMITARAFGLDCGPMAGFDKEKVNQEFFSGTSIRANFLCNLGYGDPEGLHPRSPRFTFDEVCSII
ncbi:MAG: malonic semialdehyde reductase [Waddliaceae bacterium]|nr:malonic semialdehyde reductase [Waddliaceae bacterium]